MTAPDLRAEKEPVSPARGGGSFARGAARGLKLWWLRRARSGRGEAQGTARLAWRGILLRIFIINFSLVALVALGMVYLAIVRGSIIEERAQSLMIQGRIVAQLIAEKATSEEFDTPLDLKEAERVMSTAVGVTNTRARFFSVDGISILDTRYLLPRNQVLVNELPLPGQAAPRWTLIRTVRQTWTWLQRRLQWGGDLELYQEGPDAPGSAFPEVIQAIDKGVESQAIRQSETGDVIISVAVPIRRLVGVRGALQMSTEGGDLDDIIWADIRNILGVTGGVLVVGIVLTLYMGRQIATPIRRLAFAADQVRRGEADESAIPDLSHSPTEIAALAASFRAMTAALTERLNAIENFAADVAHEIKNPLTSLRSAIETLARTQDPERAKKLMGLIQNDVRRIDRLISDISDASRLDAELAREKSTELDLVALTQTILSLYQDQDPPLAVRFALDMSGVAASLRVHGREGALAQVFRNILDNAISFSPKDGLIELRLARDGAQAVIEIQDQGPGIPPESLSRIFERFYTHRPASHGFGKNSGLGLSISKLIVESHGGAIVAANRTDRTGAIMKVTLPAA